uniref:Uncharacterized protein n=1 Tax=Peronospora matthiolae TaxID=2874970 RepID=A0AAV1UWW8_9STRA
MDALRTFTCDRSSSGLAKLGLLVVLLLATVVRWYQTVMDDEPMYVGSCASQGQADSRSIEGPVAAFILW